MQVVTKNEMYTIDREAMDLGLHGEMLMENAGQAITASLVQRLTKRARILVVIGKGNNGGDGFVIARMLKSYGFETDVWLATEKADITGDAEKAMNIYERSGYTMSSYCEKGVEAFKKALAWSTHIIDAMLGIGMMGSLKPPYQELISLINAEREKYVIAIDLPSGVLADNGTVSEAIQADETIVIHHPKLSAFMYPSRRYYGEVHVVHIGIPPLVSERVNDKRYVWTAEDVMRTFPKRKPESHKGTHGKGLLIGGSTSMSGAIIMSAKAAIRSGSGLLTVAVPEEARPAVANHVIEAMYLDCPSKQGYFAGKIEQLQEQDFDAIAVGPGMGRHEGSRLIVKDLLTKDVPLLLDADALYHLADMLEQLKARKSPTILTPHEGEMARLLGVSAREVNANRFQLSREFAIAYGVYVVLKGSFTICTTPAGEQFINSTGNVALAKGGSGDVLTGIMLALLMQHTSLQAAVSNAVYVHGRVADELVKKDHSPIDVIASDLIEALPDVYRLIANTSL